MSSAGSAAAAQEAAGLDDLDILGWSLSNVRVGMRIAPDYLGSDDYRFEPSGALVLTRRSGQPSYSGPDDGVSIGLVGGGRLNAGVVGRWRGSRDDDDDLQGMEKIDWAVEAGVFVNWWPTEWLRLRGELRQGFNGHDSLVGSLGADFIRREGPWALTAGPRLAWSDDAFTRTYFGVTPQEAARSPFGVPPYAPSGSTLAPGAVVSAEYRFARRWSATVFGDYRRLTRDAADSPLVATLGSPDQFRITAGVRYWFGQ